MAGYNWQPCDKLSKIFSKPEVKHLSNACISVLDMGRIFTDVDRATINAVDTHAVIYFLKENVYSHRNIYKYVHYKRESNNRMSNPHKMNKGG